MAGQLLDGAAMLTVVGLMPLMVVAQVGTITMTVGGQSSFDIPNNAMTHMPDCPGNPFTGTWTATLTGTPCSTMAIWITSAADCAAAPTANDFQLPQVPQSTFFGTPNPHTGTVQFTINDILSSGGDAGVTSCGALGVQQTFLLCAAISMDSFATCQTKQTVQTTLTAMTAASITYDTKPPSPPNLTDVEPLDSALAISFQISADTDPMRDFIYVELSQNPDAGFTRQSMAVSAGQSMTTVSGLTNGTTYFVQLVAQDAANNVSGPSNIRSATPQASSGFFGAYRADGGPPPGCSGAPGAVVLALAALWLARRRRS
jgi:hypothetical protein